MTVKIQGTRRSYIGLSTDTKPDNSSDEGTIPAGSTFFETDSGNTAIWDGYKWIIPRADMTVADKLDTIILELRELKELHFNVAARMMRE